MRISFLTGFLGFLVFSSAQAGYQEQLCLKQIDIDQAGALGQAGAQGMQDILKAFKVSRPLARVKEEMAKCLGQEVVTSLPMVAMGPSPRTGEKGVFVQVIVAGEKDACIVQAESMVSLKQKEGTTGEQKSDFLAVPTFVFSPLFCNGPQVKEQEI